MTHKKNNHAKIILPHVITRISKYNKNKAEVKKNVRKTNTVLLLYH